MKSNPADILLDRISYSFGCKINMGNYETVDIHMSYSTDVRGDEAVTDTLKRAQEFVEEQIEEKQNEFIKTRR